MHLLQVSALFIIPYILTACAVPLTKSKSPKQSCRSTIPLLDEEQLYIHDPAGYQSPFWNFGATKNPFTGGTPARKPALGYLNAVTSSEADDISILPSGVNNTAYNSRIANVRNYPWNTIGRISFKRFKGDKGGWCTGTLVGRDLILTASHCFPWDYSDGRWMRFAPGFGNDTEPFGGSYVSRCRGVKNTFNVTGIDYVVCHLCQPLGDKLGWMGTRWWNNESMYLNRSWSSSGYPIDSFHGQAQMFIPSINLFEIEYHADLGVELESKTFASSGWSGGPMWGYIGGEPTIVGVCSGAEKDCSERVGGCLASDNEEYHDVSAGGKLMTDLVLYGKTRWGSG